MGSKFVLAFSCIFILFWSLQLVQASVICPTADAYAPCDCHEYVSASGAITIDCALKNLTDSKMSDILKVFLTTPSISPVFEIDLSSNQLTRIPNEIRSFTQLEEVYLDSNPIESIESNDLNISGRYPSYLSIGNQLKTIAPGAFKGFVILTFFSFSIYSKCIY